MHRKNQNKIAKVKLFIVGGDGFVGASLVSYFRKIANPLIYTTVNRAIANEFCIYLNLMDDPDKWTLPESIEMAVLSAGITKLDDCERDKKGTAKINVEKTTKLAEMLIGRGAKIVFLSSNLVFDGSKSYPSHDDPVSPVIEYGRQKAETEERLMSYNQQMVTVLRLTKVLGSYNQLFTQWIENLKNNQIIYPFFDMYMAPIPVSFVATVIRLIMDREVYGIYHLSAEKDLSYSEIANACCKILGFNPDKIKPVSAETSDLPPGILNINKTALDICRLKADFGISPPDVLWTIKQAFTNPKVLEGLIS